ncbi:MAG: hypothetical protein NTW85_15650 [Methylococcales bacterium]|nr:hypothetical protein [Methylococcales bacterium]
MKLILQITLGVSLGIVLGGSFLYLYTGVFAEQLVSAALKTLPPPKSSAVDSVLPATLPPPIAPKPIEEPTTAPAPPISTTPAPIAEINPIVKDPAIIAEEEDQKQMGIKFKASYKKSDKCQSPNLDHNLLVTCGNEYIRARDKFEKSWRLGEVKK